MWFVWAVLPEFVRDTSGELSGVAGAVTAIAAASLLVPKCWRWFTSRRSKAMDAAASRATAELLATLMRPNGGKSLADISAAVARVEQSTGEARIEMRAIDQRMSRIESQVDDVLIRNQSSIKDSVRSILERP